jgi:hypothetical protein
MQISKIPDNSKRKKVKYIFEDIWDDNYSISLNKMENAIIALNKITDTTFYQNKIKEIVYEICDTRIDCLEIIGKSNEKIQNNYEYGKNLIKQNKYAEGFNEIKQFFEDSNNIIQGKQIQDNKIKESIESKNMILFYFLLSIIVFLILLILVRKY